MSWSIDFEDAEKICTWEGEIGKASMNDDSQFTRLSNSPLHFLRERVTIDQSVIVSREMTHVEFRGNALPKLKSSESVVSLLANESEIELIRGAFVFLTFVSGNIISYDGHRFASKREKGEFLSTFENVRKKLSNVKEEQGSLVLRIFGPILRWVASGEGLKDSEIWLAHITKRWLPDRFSRIIENFREIFPSVTEVIVDFEDQLRDGGDPLLLQFAIKEQSCNQWILQPQMSSGMLRTLIHLFAVDAALPGSVLVIDEFENSLGENCLSRMTETLLEHVGEVQFILTSHHPYVIHNIPVDCWQLVRRHGSTVTLTSARDIPALMSESHHDAFTRLLNLKEFQEGIEITDESGTV